MAKKKKGTKFKKVIYPHNLLIVLLLLLVVLHFIETELMLY